MTNSNVIPATLILSLFSSIVHGQDYNERTGKLLKASNDFQCFSDGFHVDPNDCSVFYRCTDWGESSENSIQSRFIPIKFRCAEGTVFDIERSNCVNVEETSRLECRQLADDNVFGRISEREAGDPDYGVVQPSPEYNNQYQPPSYNRPGPQEPGEQIPDNSGNGDGNNNEPTSSSTSPPCEADGFFPIPNDCTHFYRCVSSGNGFLKYDFSCGPGTVWDPDNNACNHPWATSRPDCRSGTDGSQGGSETIEISESPETAAQVAEPSSTTTVASTTNRPTTRPNQSTTSSSYNRPTTSSSYNRPTTTKSSTTTTKRSTTNVPSTTTTTNSPNTSPVTEGPKDNSTDIGNSCSSEGFFPDEKNCTKFYRCVDEGNGKFTKYEFECAEGTVWDVQETTCNYPYAIQNDICNSSSSETQTATTTGQTSGSTSSSSQTSSRPVSSTTSSSYNRPTSQSTSSTSQQSSSSQTTSSSSQTSSSTSQASSSSSQMSSSSSQTTSSQQTSSSTSSTSSQSTSSNQQTSSSQQSSNSTSASNQNSTSSNATGSTTSSNNGNQTSKADKCEADGFFPSSENCNKFYRCVSNEAGGYTKYNFNCGPGTVWDPENNVCNHPWAVKDEKCRSGAQGTTPMSESTTQSSTTSSSQNTTSPSLSSTTESLNQTTTTSPTESSSQSTSSVTTTETTSKPEETSDGGNTTATTDSTDVSTTPASNSTATTTEAGSNNSTKPINGIKCEKAGYYPNPKDCKKFYRCVDWDGDKGERFSVYHFDCPAGTIFDPSLNICNHEESVYPPRDCTGSGSQTTDSTPTSKPDNSTNTESPSTTENSNTTDATEISSEPTTIQATTDASTNATEPSTTGSSETTPQITTQPETTTRKEIETTTVVTSVTTTPVYTTTSNQISTTQPTTTEISTTPSSSENCPELGPDQYALVCPTGFRRHPKFCNLFYQCTVSKSMETKIVTLSCVNGTLYDEKKIQCLPPEETKKCEGSMMADARNLKKTDSSVTPIVVKSDKSICPNEGSFTYKDDCRLFYKCKKDEQGKMTGFLYQCPEGFAFWSVSKRCEKTEKVPCENPKTSPTSWRSTLAPVESKNIGF